ncbi:MAG TPA: hypothetical protein ENG63_00175 [Candidatus Desulfofervidus auxilii]|uniref:CheW-like domain-containing protein n=1 Tax=Desulfofervidus auxilii TaxID=1621989 RepID=A0A7C0U1D1_DESA2|nr:hypothetical protein [Candidatus Desulfofervidus auxilii]
MKTISVILFREKKYLLASLVEEIKGIRSFSPKTKLILKDGEEISINAIIGLKSFSIKNLYPLPSYIKLYTKYHAVWGLILLKGKIIPLVDLKKFLGREIK